MTLRPQLGPPLAQHVGPAVRQPIDGDNCHQRTTGAVNHDTRFIHLSEF